jgi:hypothetical protein
MLNKTDFVGSLAKAVAALNTGVAATQSSAEDLIELYLPALLKTQDALGRVFPWESGYHSERGCQARPSSRRVRSGSADPFFRNPEKTLAEI